MISLEYRRRQASAQEEIERKTMKISLVERASEAIKDDNINIKAYK